MVKASAWTMPFADELVSVEPSPAPASNSTPAPAPPPTYVSPQRNANLSIPLPPPPIITATIPTPHPFATNPAEAIFANLSPFLHSPAGTAPTNGNALPYGTTNLTAATNAGAYSTYLFFVQQLVPLQRSLLLLNLQKAHYLYAGEVRRRLVALGWADEPAPGKKPGKGEGEAQVKEVRDADGEVVEVKNLMVDCGLWGVVEDNFKKGELELQSWDQDNQAQADDDQFQIVQLNGLPFLLHLPPAFAAAASAPPPNLYLALKRARAISAVLTVMLQLLITYQPSASVTAHGRTLVRHPGQAIPPPSPFHNLLAPPVLPLPGEVRAAAAAAAVGAGPGGAAERERRAERGAQLAIVINLEAVGAIIVPLVLLALKLAFLLWIFGRNAGTRKRYILAGMAGVWILWEGWRLLRLRANVRREADRGAALRARLAELRERRDEREGIAAELRDEVDGLRRRVARIPPLVRADAEDRIREGAAAGLNQAQPEAVAGPAPPQAAADPDRDRPHPRPARRARPPTSRLTPKYWINWVAAFGLAAEAREMGLVPRSIAGRPVARPERGAGGGAANEAGAGRRRAWRTLLTAVVLFVGTLSPEVERKRKKALEKRDRMVAEKIVHRRRREEATAAAVATAAMGSEPAGPAPTLEGETAGAAEGMRSVASTPVLFGSRDGTGPLTPPHASPVPPPLNQAGSTIRGPSPADTLAAIPPGNAFASGSDSSPSSLQAAADFSSGPAPAGRAVVSDAELFADGPGEPEQEERGTAESPVVGTDEEGVAVGEGESTDDEGGGEERRERQGGEPEEVDEIVALF